MMSPHYRQIIYNAIKALDKNNEVIVKLSLERNFISYSDKIIQHRGAVTKLTDEELVKAFLITKLICELKYPIDSIEKEKAYIIGRPKKSEGIIDILVKDKQNKKRTFLFIEVKTPDTYEADKKFIDGQLFKLAKQEIGVRYLTYYTAEIKGNEVQDKALIIDHQKYSDFDQWVEAGQVSLDRIPAEYGIARKSIYVNKKTEDLDDEEKNLNKTLTKNDFRILRKDFHDVLWGGGGNYNYIFSNLIKVFLAKIYDEYATSEGEAYKFQISYKDNKLETPLEVYGRVNKLLKDSQRDLLNYEEEVIKNSVGIDREQISESKVTYVVEKLQGISLLENENKHEGDLLGEFFEEIVSTGFRQSRGQFFTHPNIVKFIIYALGIDNLAINLLNNPAKPRLPYICDPACGSGTFLIEVMKFITHTVKERKADIKKTSKVEDFIVTNFPSRRENIWAREFTYGIEKDGDLGLTTKVNMILHGDGNINIFITDGLLPFNKYISKSPYGNLLNYNQLREETSYKYEINNKFDVIISNPPFSVKLDTETQKGLFNRFLYADKKKSENLFIERWYQLLREEGRMGVVLPESVFDTVENKYIRLFLYKYFKILAIVSLPELAFAPYTSTPTNLLFAEKKTEAEIKVFEELWQKYSNEYQRLKRKILKYQNGEIESQIKAKENLIRYLKTYFRPEDKKLDIKKLLNKYKEEIFLVHKGDKQADGSIINEWWVFNEVARELDYSIFLTRVAEIGYKRLKRGEQKRPNELFRADGLGNPTINDDKTIVNLIRNKKYNFRFSDFGIEQSLRADPKFITHFKNFSGNIQNYVELTQIVDVASDKFERGLPEKIDYVEISNVDNYGSFIPITVYLEGNEDPENTRLVEKIEKGDIQKAKEGDILLACTRPYLKKFIFISKDDEVVYFTKAFIKLRSKFLSPIFLYALIRNDWVVNQLTRVNHTGKTYPVIKTNDLRFVYLPKHILKLRDIDAKGKKIATAYKEIEILKERIRWCRQVIDKVIKEAITQ